VHELFRITEKLPMPAGQSPFHIRGLYYDRLFSRVRQLRGGMDELNRQIVDDGVRKFVNQKFTWMGWYDALPTVPICAAVARMTGEDFETSVREGTRIASLKLVPKIFRMVLSLSSAGASAARITQHIMSTVDYVQIGEIKYGDGHATGTGYGMPLLVAPHASNLMLGFMQGVLEASGANDVRAKYTDVALDGTREGYHTVTIRYEFHWKQERGT
jgi:hypothetical protein